MKTATSRVGQRKTAKKKMPDFAARARRIFGNRKINTAAILDHSKGRH
jgi:hypothetical protein